MPPKHKMGKFTCPLCYTLAPQEWTCFVSYGQVEIVNNLQIWTSLCTSCKKNCLWHGGEKIYPDTSNAPLPNEDLSSEVREIYQEAASILQKSPRAAAALLRLAIEHLCKEQECKGKTLHDQIKSLAEKDHKLQKVVESLDIVRFVGNAGVHAGTIQINENPDIVEGMFALINYAANQLLTAQREQEEIIARTNKLRDNQKTE